MAVPKRKKSLSKKRSRRANWKLSLPTLVACPQCHEFKVPHRVCGYCGYYKGVEVIAQKEA